MAARDDEVRTPCVDFRSPEKYAQGHLVGATNIPWINIDSYSFELPPRDVLFDIVLSSLEERDAILAFIESGRWQVGSTFTEDSISGEMAQVGTLSRALWKASPFLESQIDGIEERLVNAGVSRPFRALDVGSGAGRDSVFLALRGWTVLAVDNFPRALERVQLLADHWDVSGLVQTLCIDVEKESLVSVENQFLKPENKAYHLIMKCRYLYRPLFPCLTSETMLANQGSLLVHTFVKSKVHPLVKPKSPNKYLLPDEIEELCSNLTTGHCMECLLPTKQPILEYIGFKAV
jgi:SAM-dependent methyltransferase